MDTTPISITVEIEDVGQRLDRFLTLHLTQFSRTRLKEMLDQGAIIGQGSKASYLVQLGEIYTITPPEIIESAICATPMILDIVYEDEYLLVINKPSGLVVHPAAGHYQDTLVNGLLAHEGMELSSIGGVNRPGIVHRLDKDTSGLMIVAKDDKTHHALSEQLQNRTLQRTYLAFLWGITSTSKGTVETMIGRHPHHRQKMTVLKRGGKEAVTLYETIENYTNHSPPISLVRFSLKTGRTHQIRVHAQHLGHPLVGDCLYGRSRSVSKNSWAESIIHFPRQALHATAIEFMHPHVNQLMRFEIPLAQDLENLKKLLVS